MDTPSIDGTGDIRNGTRAQRAEDALRFYVEAKGETFENNTDEAADLVADLLHLVAREHTRTKPTTRPTECLNEHGCTSTPSTAIRKRSAMLDRSLPTSLRVLVACEFSGIVRDAFLEKGHDAWSCDLLPAEHDSNRHIQGDVRDVLNDGWDFLIVAHPPCTRLCNSGVRWLHKAPPGKTVHEMWDELRAGAELFSDLWNAPIPHICVENPVMHSHAKRLIRNYVEFAQSVQPWQFGHPETKRTCFWLKNLPNLRPTDIVEGRAARVHRMPPGPDRWRERSRFFPGIAKAMADQWGDPLQITPRQQARLL